jgi:hypothetical protein
MTWKKKGLIFEPDGSKEWMMSHAQLPLVDQVNDDLLRVYFGTRDRLNRTVTTYIEVMADHPETVLHVSGKPVLGLGNLGCFDDSGAMPSWIVNDEGIKYLYYIGWNVGTAVPYRTAIGIALSEDGGRSFRRKYEGPILDRNDSEPYSCATPCVLVEHGVWRMWYQSCVKWDLYGEKPEPFYHIKYAESRDGFRWSRKGRVCIDFKSSNEAGITRPSILKEDGIYKMWYCYRGLAEYRTNKEMSYRIGYAESEDGFHWRRKDELAAIGPSENGWDSEMIAYPQVYQWKGLKHMLYNGNGFGRSGFGYALWEEG